MQIHRTIAFLLPTLLVIAPSAAMAAGSQAGTAEPAQTTPASQPEPAAEPADAARVAGQPIGGIVVKGKSISEQGVRREAAPVQSEAAAREGPRTYTGGRRNEAAQAGQVPPTGTAKSISEKGVNSTKSR